MIVFVTIATALADIPPGPGFVETCTTEVCKGAESASCSAYFGGRQDCEALEKTGFVKSCQTYGASAWTEILCKGPAKPVDPTPVKPVDPKPADPKPADIHPNGGQETARCDTTAGTGGLGALILLAAALVRRR